MAMFRKGDRVQYYGPDGRAYPEQGTVLSVKTVKGEVDRLAAAKAMPDERKRLDALRREIFAASRFRN